MANTTWNPADKSAAITLSSGNLVATATGSVSGVRAIDKQITGKFYWEYTVTTWAGGNTNVGIGLLSIPLSYSLSSAGTCIVYKNGFIYINNNYSGSQLGGVLVSGNTIGIAVDFTAQLIWFRLCPSGAWNGNSTANPDTGIGGISLNPINPGAGVFGLYPIAGFTVISDSVTANFGDSTFSGTVPSSFTSGFTAGATITDYEIATQLTLEQWGTFTPSVELTQIAIEQWSQVALGSTQFIATQFAIEEWATAFRIDIPSEIDAKSWLQAELGVTGGITVGPAGGAGGGGSAGLYGPGEFGQGGQYDGTGGYGGAGDDYLTPRQTTPNSTGFTGTEFNGITGSGSGGSGGSWGDSGHGGNGGRGGTYGGGGGGGGAGMSGGGLGGHGGEGVIYLQYDPGSGPVYIVLTKDSGGSFTIPSNWSLTNNTVLIVGAGGCGSNGSLTFGGNGGGGGSVVAAVNTDIYTPGQIIPLDIPSAAQVCAGTKGNTVFGIHSAPPGINGNGATAGTPPVFIPPEHGGISSGGSGSSGGVGGPGGGGEGGGVATLITGRIIATSQLVGLATNNAFADGLANGLGPVSGVALITVAAPEPEITAVKGRELGLVVSEIPLNPENQKFHIDLNGVDYTFTLRWNMRGNVWILNIGDTNERPLINGIPLLLGVNLLAGFKSFAIGGVGANLFIHSSTIPEPAGALPQNPNFAELGSNTRLYFGLNQPIPPLIISRPESEPPGPGPEPQPPVIVGVDKLEASDTLVATALALSVGAASGIGTATAVGSTVAAGPDYGGAVMFDSTNFLWNFPPMTDSPVGTLSYWMCVDNINDSPQPFWPIDGDLHNQGTAYLMYGAQDMFWLTYYDTSSGWDTNLTITAITSANPTVVTFDHPHDVQVGVWAYFSVPNWGTVINSWVKVLSVTSTTITLDIDTSSHPTFDPSNPSSRGGGLLPAHATMLYCENMDGSAYADYQIGQSIPVRTWINVLRSWDMNHPAGAKIYQLYYNDVPIPGTPYLRNDTHAAFSIGYSAPNDFDNAYIWSIGSDGGYPLYVRGMMCYLSEFWFAPGQFIDFTDPVNRAKFRNPASGKPVFLGTNGSTPTGTVPTLYQTIGRTPPADPYARLGLPLRFVNTRQDYIQSNSGTLANGITNSSTLVFSIWLWGPADLEFNCDTNNVDITIYGDSVDVYLWNSTHTNRLHFSFLYLIPVGLNNIRFSVDTNHPVGLKIINAYINNTPVAVTINVDTAPNLVVNWVDTAYYFQTFAAFVAEVWIAPNQFFDISNKFIDTSGNPVNHGANGQLISGTAPSFYFNISGTTPAENFASNRGSGGACTLMTDPTYPDIGITLIPPAASFLKSSTGHANLHFVHSFDNFIMAPTNPLDDA